jgi:glycosyltransferase involved in cell wall biosynthesis
MKPRLSIIMPCYNCEATLKEAVDSCYAQGLESFELVMVNDGSTDGTWAFMEGMARERKNIRIFSQPRNMGGGAARNRAVEESLADTIFCLDSDDALPPNMLRTMFDFLVSKRADGVVFSGSRVFSTDIASYRENRFEIALDRRISPRDILSGKAWGTGANFMYTKQAFIASGTYPTHHHFDTQGFGARFLLTGHSAYACPESFFYQRQMTSNYSYFERSANAGEFSIGYYYIFRELCHLWKDSARQSLLTFDIFKNDVNAFFMGLEKSEEVFDSRHETLLAPNGREGFIDKTPDSAVIAIQMFLEGNHEGAIGTLAELPLTPALAHELLCYALRGHDPSAKIGDVNKLTKRMQLKVYTSKTKRLNLWQRIARKLTSIINHE